MLYGHQGYPRWHKTKRGYEWGRKSNQGWFSFSSTEPERPWYRSSYRIGHVNTWYLDDKEGRYMPPQIRSRTIVV